MTIHIPMRTGRGLNGREHHLVRHRRVKGEREAVYWMLRPSRKPALPCVVLLTRVSPSNGLDDDNLAGALKAVRDEIAEWLGVNDRDINIVRYEYAQRRAKVWGVEIDFKEQP